MVKPNSEVNPYQPPEEYGNLKMQRSNPNKFEVGKSCRLHTEVQTDVFVMPVKLSSVFT
jgi:hypothetical protein